MIVFPNCKINLGLNILRKRNDGYHDLETIFYPLPLTDVLEIIECKQPERTVPIPFINSGILIQGDTLSNICVKAYRLLKKDFPRLPFVQMHLHKIIPSGAGLGGGSADAAFTLQLLNQQYGLKLNLQQLITYASHLGSDCPFFIINKPCFASGRGELLEEIKLSLVDYKFVLVNPGIHIDTGKAFLEMSPSLREKSVKEIIQHPVESWKDELINDFETPIFRQHPEIGIIKDQLYHSGAVYASMSGSGSSVFGIFRKDIITNLPFPHYYFIRELSIGYS